MKSALLAAGALAAWAAGAAQAGTVTIEPAPPLPAVPSGWVDRRSLDPVMGIDVAPPRAPAAYVPETYARPHDKRMPIPGFNPVAVSWCQMDLS